MDTNMNLISDNLIKYSKLNIGNGNIIGNNVIIGYPSRDKLFSAIKNNLSFDKIICDGEVFIGSDCIIRDGAILYERIKIGDKLQTGHNIQIREDVSIGHNCILGTKSVIEYDVRIGNSVSLATGCFLCPGTIVHDFVQMGPYVVTLDSKYLDYKISPSKGPIIHKNAKIGGNVTLLPGIVIGENSIVGAGSVVTKDVLPGNVVAGNPAVIISSKVRD